MIKKLFNTLLILLSIAFAGVAICIAVMMIFPSVKIFGYSYSADRLEQTAYISELANINDINEIKTINIETGNYNVAIVKSDFSSNDALVRFNSKYFGIAKNSEGSALKAGFSKDYDVLTKTLTFKVNEPSGLIIRTSTFLNLELGKNINLDNLNLLINGKADFEVDEHLNLQATNFKFVNKTSKGAINLVGLKVSNNLEIETEYGRLDLTNAASENASLNLKTRGGNFTLKNVEDLTVESETTPYVTVENVSGDINYVCKSGTLNVTGTVNGSVKVNTDSAALRFGTIKNKIDLTAYNGTGNPDSASIEVDTLGTNGVSATQIITLKNGYVKINNVFSTLTVNTEKGDVTLGTEANGNADVCADVNVKTTRGRITVYFETGNAHYMNIESVSGEIKAYNVNAKNSGENVSTIKTTEESYITVEFASINNRINVIGATKNVTLYVPVNFLNSLSYDLATRRGNINVNLTGLALNYELNSGNYESFVANANNINGLTGYQNNATTSIGCKYKENTNIYAETSTGNIYVNELV